MHARAAVGPPIEEVGRGAEHERRLRLQGVDEPRQTLVHARRQLRLPIEEDRDAARHRVERERRDHGQNGAARLALQAIRIDHRELDLVERVLRAMPGGRDREAALRCSRRGAEERVGMIGVPQHHLPDERAGAQGTILEIRCRPREGDDVPCPVECSGRRLRDDGDGG